MSRSRYLVPDTRNLRSKRGLMQELDYSGVGKEDPLPHWLVTQNLISLTARVEQLEMDIKRLEGVIISITEERRK